MVLDYIHCGIGDPILLSMVSDTIKSSPVMTYTFKKNEEILSLYSEYGVSNAYVIPVKSTKKDCQDRGVLTVMAIGMDDGEFRIKSKRFGPLLKVLADAISFLNETDSITLGPKTKLNRKLCACSRLWPSVIFLWRKRQTISVSVWILPTNIWHWQSRL